MTHSIAKGGTSFSFDIIEKSPLPWKLTERAKVEVSYSGEDVFVGNILSRSRDFSSLITNYNALGYYTHTRRNPIIGKFKNPFSTIINQLLDGMLKAYGISFMKDAEFINSIIEELPEVIEEIKEEE